MLNQLAYQIEQAYDRLKWAIRRKLGLSPIKILPYMGYGTSTRFYVLGRVLADYNVSPATKTDRIWRNIVNMIRRFRSHEIPRARVQAEFQNQKAVTQANEEGHFRCQLELQTPVISNEIWHDVTLTLPDPPGPSTGPTVGRVLVPPSDAEFGVISDLDDTVIQTNVLSVLQAARNTFLRNAYTRLEFPGVAAFYQALQRGTGRSVNPIFYVSNMPWNLYDLMHDFFDIRHIPHGPMFLINLGLTDTHFIRESGRAHKREHINRILDTYPDLPFILIGDAGEEDPVIYFDTLETYPERIRAIYIRDIPGNENEAAIRDLIVEAAQLHVDLVLVPDTLAAAEHAAQQGFITLDSVEKIRAEIQETGE